jgi:hypothetical protein
VHVVLRGGEDGCPDGDEQCVGSERSRQRHHGGQSEPHGRRLPALAREVDLEARQ